MVNNCSKSNTACNVILHLLIYNYWLKLTWTGHGTACMAQLCMAWHSMARHGSASALGFRLGAALGTQLLARLGLCSQLGSRLGLDLSSARLLALGSRLLALGSARLGSAWLGTAWHCMARHGTAWLSLTWPVNAISRWCYFLYSHWFCLSIHIHNLWRTGALV